MSSYVKFSGARSLRHHRPFVRNVTRLSELRPPRLCALGNKVRHQVPVTQRKHWDWTFPASETFASADELANLMEATMQHSSRTIVLSIVLLSWLLIPSLIVAADPAAAAPAAGASTVNPEPTTSAATSLSEPNMNAALLQMLVSKGILSQSEANSLGAANGGASTQQLLLLLKQKGLLSDSDMAALEGGLPERTSDHMLADIKYSDNLVTAQVGQAAGPAKPKEPPAPPPVIPAIAPVRVLPIDPPAKEGVVPGFTLGGVKVRPYGFIKATMALTRMTRQAMTSRVLVSRTRIPDRPATPNSISRRAPLAWAPGSSGPTNPGN